MKTSSDRYSSAAPFRFAALILLLAALAGILAGCGSGGGETGPTEAPPVEIIDVRPGSTSSPVTAVTPDPTPAPTAEPDTLEGKILAGVVYPIGRGEPIGDGFEAESVDIDRDGVSERLSVEDIDGGPTFCIDGAPFMDIGNRLFLASPDGRSMVFLSQKPGEDGYFAFYPDEDGNLYCRLFAIARSGSPEQFTVRSSVEEQIMAGLDVMLHNPMLYDSVSESKRSLRLDLNGDGSKETIEFDSAVLTVNGIENAAILSTTMPRFIYDAEHDAIVLYGSAGDYALRLRYDGSELIEDISYASLL